ncbi:hypothetical protein JCM3766R1_004230 [Sporobolomyces carnicolor]
MNSLPTELLSTIIDYAASCDSTEESYRSRLELLSSLALVNRALHQIAQPLLSRKVIIKSDKQWLSSKGPTFQAAIESLASREYQHAVLTSEAYRVSNFELFKGGQIVKLTNAAIAELARLSLKDSDVKYGADITDISLSTVEELSLDGVQADCVRGPTDFLTIERFPSLRALAAFVFDGWIDEVGTVVQAKLAESLLSRLDCIVTDDIEALLHDEPPSPASARRVVPPVLFDFECCREDHSSCWRTLASDSRLSAHVRLRRSYELPLERGCIDAAFSAAEQLLKNSNTLKGLYLDLLPRRQGVYELDDELAASIDRIADLGRQSKVKIVWESHQDDWCRSLVSKEFWKRRKAERDEQKEQKRT